ncbi:MAG: hypothetical protein QXO71_00625 [Candidatus Jordarchaeaceae archaeon]
MPRLTKIAEKAREQKALKHESEDVSRPPITESSGVTVPKTSDTSGRLTIREDSIGSLEHGSEGIKIVEKIVYRYVRKDPDTRLDTNFNVRMPSNYLSFLKEKFGERGATVFCRIAILEKMEKIFSKEELDSLKLHELLDEQKQSLTRK